MIFNEWSYALFLLLGVLGLALFPRPWRPGWLALLGAAFYAYYGGLWLVIFVVEIIISRWYAPRSRVALFGIVQAVLILLVVKYGAFFWGVGAELLHPGSAHAHQMLTHPWPLPLALSFFIFEFIHYAADRYRGTAPDVDPITYASFILFFPTMIAGPIKRVQGFVGSIRSVEISAADLWTGALRVIVGLCKKAIIADNLDVLLGGAFTPLALSARPRTLWLWILIYGWRIYIDFSAYSDIAIGSARMLGVSVPENFNWPYLARSPSEFWRRWHISLSRWITDYIYVPLGGSRSASRARVAVNTVVAMGLSGLWHGAAGNFVVWGLYHALLIIGYRGSSRVWRRWVPPRYADSALAQPMYLLATYLSITFGWVFFAMPLDLAWRYAARMLGL